MGRDPRHGPKSPQCDCHKNKENKAKHHRPRLQENDEASSRYGTDIWQGASTMQSPALDPQNTLNPVSRRRPAMAQRQRRPTQQITQGQYTPDQRDIQNQRRHLAGPKRKADSPQQFGVSAPHPPARPANDPQYEEAKAGQNSTPRITAEAGEQKIQQGDTENQTIRDPSGRDIIEGSPEQKHHHAAQARHPQRPPGHSRDGANLHERYRSHLWISDMINCCRLSRCRIDCYPMNRSSEVRWPHY